LVHQLKEADAKVLFCHPDLIAVAHEAVQELHWSAQQQKDNVVFALDRAEVQDTSHRTLDEIMTSDLLEPARIQQPREHVGFLCFSSGTTSAAKGVRTSHYNMTSVCLGLKPLAYQGDDIFICVLPLNHIFGLTKLCINPVAIGATVVMLPKFDIRHFCEVVQKYKVSTCLVVPPMILGVLSRRKLYGTADG
jgi:acyl-CoA synthetase (AMP-forming)/AMP-acid ligase II